MQTDTGVGPKMFRVWGSRPKTGALNLMGLILAASLHDPKKHMLKGGGPKSSLIDTTGP